MLKINKIIFFIVLMLIAFFIDNLESKNKNKSVRVELKDYRMFGEVAKIGKDISLAELDTMIDANTLVSNIAFNKKRKGRIKNKKSKKVKKGSLILHGKVDYYKRGNYRDRLVKTSLYRYGMLWGETRHYEGDKVVKIECYEKGEKDGYFIDYDSTGSIVLKELYEDGNLILKVK